MSPASERGSRFTTNRFQRNETSTPRIPRAQTARNGWAFGILSAPHLRKGVYLTDGGGKDQARKLLILSRIVECEMVSHLPPQLEVIFC